MWNVIQFYGFTYTAINVNAIPTAFSATWRVENLKIIFTIISSLEFKEHAIREWSEALDAPGSNGISLRLM